MSGCRQCVTYFQGTNQCSVPGKGVGIARLQQVLAAIMVMADVPPPSQVGAGALLCELADRIKHQRASDSRQGNAHHGCTKPSACMHLPMRFARTFDAR